MTQRKLSELGKGWRRYGVVMDLGQDPLVSTLEAALKGRRSVSLQGKLGSHPFFTRTRGNVVRVVLVIDANLTFCFQEDRAYLTQVLSATSEEILIRALYLMGQRAKVGSADLNEAAARKWIGI